MTVFNNRKAELGLNFFALEEEAKHLTETTEDTATEVERIIQSLQHLSPAQRFTTISSLYFSFIDAMWSNQENLNPFTRLTMLTTAVRQMNLWISEHASQIAASLDNYITSEGDKP